MNGREHDILDDGLIIKEVELLEDHSHMAAMDVYIDLHICDIYAIEDYMTRGGILHTVKATKEGRLSAAGGTYNADDIALIYSDADALKDFKLTEAFFEIDNVYKLIVSCVCHCASAPFP